MKDTTTVLCRECETFVPLEHCDTTTHDPSDGTVECPECRLSFLSES